MHLLHAPSFFFNNSLYIKSYNKTKRFLKDNPEPLVLKADKGNITVLMTKQDYSIRMNELLNDKTVYEEMQKDLTSSPQKDVNELIKKWAKHKRYNEHIIDRNSFDILNLN